MDSHEEALRFTGPVRSKDIAALRALLAEGANPNAKPQNGNAALHDNAIFGSVELVPILVEAGTLIDATNHMGRTPLHLAAERGDEAMVQALLDAGADPAIRDINGDTAAELGELALAVKSLEGPDIADFKRIVEAKPHLVGRRIHVGIWRGGTLLHCAIEHKNAEAAAFLLERGADIEALRGVPGSALGGFVGTPLAAACAWPNDKIVAMLLARGAVVDPEHGRPLHSAAAENRPKIVKMLLEAGADPNRLDERGCTPLYLAATWGKKCGKVLELLLERGADPRFIGPSKKSIVCKLAEELHWDEVAILHRYGCYVSEKWDKTRVFQTLYGTIDGKYPPRFDSLLREPVVQQVVRTTLGRDLIAWALAKGQHEIVEMLVKAGAPVRGRHQNGYTLLHMVPLDSALYQLFLAHGAEESEKDVAGNTAAEAHAIRRLWRTLLAGNLEEVLQQVLATPGIEHRHCFMTLNLGGGRETATRGNLLHLAVWMRAEGVIRWLITQRGADPNCAAERYCNGPSTPLEIARFLKADDIAALLLEHGAKETTP